MNSQSSTEVPEEPKLEVEVEDLNEGIIEDTEETFGYGENEEVPSKTEETSLSSYSVSLSSKVRCETSGKTVVTGLYDVIERL